MERYAAELQLMEYVMGKKSLSALLSIGGALFIVTSVWFVQPALVAQNVPTIVLFPPPLIDIDTVC